MTHFQKRDPRYTFKVTDANRVWFRNDEWKYSIDFKAETSGTTHLEKVALPSGAFDVIERWLRGYDSKSYVIRTFFIAFSNFELAFLFQLTFDQLTYSEILAYGESV